MAVNRWHELDDAIDASNLPASDKAVFRLRLKTADFTTADMSPQWTETQDVVARKASITVRQVRRSERHLEQHGWLKVSGTTGRGRKPLYALMVGSQCDCTGRVHAPAKADTRRVGTLAKADTSTPVKADTGRVRTPVKADTATPKGGHEVRSKADTKGGHVAGQSPVSTERHREGGVGEAVPLPIEDHPDECAAAPLGTGERRPGACPLCGQSHPVCEFARGTLYCVNPFCANPHHRERPGGW